MISKVFIIVALFGLTFGGRFLRHLTDPAFRTFSSPVAYLQSNYRVQQAPVPAFAYQTDNSLVYRTNNPTIYSNDYTRVLAAPKQYVFRSHPIFSPVIRNVVQSVPAGPAVPATVLQTPATIVRQAPIIQSTPSLAQANTEDDASVPTPHQFSYATTDEDGNVQTREETGDGYGTVTGSYSISGADGITRLVNYVADDAGFRADIQTNEPGTANQNPADVTITANPVQVVNQPALSFVNSPTLVKRY